MSRIDPLHRGWQCPAALTLAAASNPETWSPPMAVTASLASSAGNALGVQSSNQPILTGKTWSAARAGILGPCRGYGGVTHGATATDFGQLPSLDRADGFHGMRLVQGESGIRTRHCASGPIRTHERHDGGRLHPERIQFSGRNQFHHAPGRCDLAG